MREGLGTRLRRPVALQGQGAAGQCKTWTLDCGLDRGLDCGLDCGLDWDYVLDERSANAHQRTGVTIQWRLSTVRSPLTPPVIVIFFTSDSEQSDPETQESVALKLLGMQP